MNILRNQAKLFPAFKRDSHQYFKAVFHSLPLHLEKRTKGIVILNGKLFPRPFKIGKLFSVEKTRNFEKYSPLDIGIGSC